jgi:diguanylate cyclase (GGDEF)-like protein
MTQRMQACDDLDALMQVITCFMPEIAPDHAGRLYLFDKERNAMTEACAWLGPNLSTSEFSPLACWALRRGEAHRPRGHAIDVPCEHLHADGGTSADTVCLPLTSQREMLGLFYLESRGDAEQATELSSVYLRLFAENVGLALGNLKLREALRELAMADPLTGLANRRRLDESLDRETKLAEGLGAPLAALMIDVDHFKRFNDTFGHEAGDRVLREVGAVLKGATRDGDLAIRYGGEEFLLLLPGMHVSKATERAEQIRERIGALRLDDGEAELGRITASVGVASTPECGSYRELLQLADAALYKAKESGRDRLIVAQAAHAGRAAETLRV